jgi:hypothetical protein
MTQNLEFLEFSRKLRTTWKTYVSIFVRIAEQFLLWKNTFQDKGSLKQLP